MTNKIVRVVTRGSDGQIKTKEFESFERLDQVHEQIGIDDCSTDLTLRGLPVYRGLVGPMADGKLIVRYESPEVFEVMTKEWSNTHIKRRRRRRAEMFSAAGDESQSAGDPAAIGYLPASGK